MRVDVCLLTGRRLELCLDQGATVADAKASAEALCGVPAACQDLFSPPELLADSTALSEGDNLRMVLRLHAGKGGFGKNLRAAGRKGPSQRAPNYNACRDLSGRRVRHVNQDKMMDAHNKGESVADAVIIGTAELTKKQQIQIQRKQKFKEQRLRREAEWAGQKRSKDDIYKEDVQNKLKSIQELQAETQNAFKDGIANAQAAAAAAAGSGGGGSDDSDDSSSDGDAASAAPSTVTATSAASSKRRRLVDFLSDSDSASGSGSDSEGAPTASSSCSGVARSSAPTSSKTGIATSVAKSKLGL